MSSRFLLSVGCLMPWAAGLFAAAPGEAPVDAAASRVGKRPEAASTAPATRPGTAGLPEGAVLRLGSGAFRHAGRVMAVDITPDGRRIASAGADGKVCVWDSQGVRLAEFAGGRNVVSLALSADGNTVWYASIDGTVQAASLGGGEPRTLRTGQRIIKAVFSADRTLGLSSDYSSAPQLWRLSDGNTLAQPESLQGYVTALALAPDKTRFATAGHNNTAGGFRVEVWDANTGEALWSYGEKVEGIQQAAAMAFSPDGKTLAVAFPDRVVLLAAADGREGKTFPLPQVQDLQYVSGGKELLAATNEGILVLDAKTGATVRRIGPKDVFTRVVPSADNSVLAACGRGQNVSIFDGRTGAPRPMTGHVRPVRALAFSRDGSSLLSAGEDGTIRRWSLAEGNEAVVAQVEEQNPQFLALSADHSTAVLFRYSNLPQTGIGVWDVAAGKTRATFSVQQGHRMAALSPDGRLVAAGGYGGLDLWQGQGGRLLARLDVPGEPRGAAAKAGRARSPWMHSAGAFSPDGKVLASAGRGFLLYELASGEEVAAESLAGAVTALAFSHDGRTLAAFLAPGGPISLYDLATMKPVGTVGEKVTGVAALAFSRDGRRLAAGLSDTTILVFDVPPEGPASQPASQPSAETLAGLWGDLASEDAEKAWAAQGSLVAAGEPAVTLLRERLKPVPKPDKPADVAALIVRLDDENFRIRDQAMKDLATLGSAAYPALREALAQTRSDEVRARASEILTTAEDPRVPDAAQLQAVRAVRVLELIGGAAARELLSALSAGGPARLTDEAAAALARAKNSGR